MKKLTNTALKVINGGFLWGSILLGYIIGEMLDGIQDGIDAACD